MLPELAQLAPSTTARYDELRIERSYFKFHLHENGGPQHETECPWQMSANNFDDPSRKHRTEVVSTARKVISC